MDYSILNLTQVADCDALLSRAAKEKADLEHQRYTENRLTTRIAEASVDINAALQSNQIEIAATDAAIDMLPDGPAKDEQINKKTRLEYKKFLLETRRESFGTVALLENELDLARVIEQLVEVDKFTESIVARKAELGG